MGAKFGFAKNVGGSLNITSGLEEFKTQMNRMHVNYLSAGSEGMEWAVKFLKVESQKRSPVDTYDLERCHVSKVKVFHNLKKITGYVMIDDSKMRFANDHSLPTSAYSVFAHELIKSSMNPSAPYSPGEKSKRKASGREVGGKFLERALEDNKELLQKMIANRIKRILK